MTSQNDAFDAEADCMRLCVDFANGVDARDYPRVVELFAPDGVLLTPAKAFRGHAGIADFLRARPLAMVTRHLCTNFRITPQLQGTATGVCYVVCFKTSCAADPEYPLKTPAPLVAEYHDTFVQTDTGWRIRERRINPVFDPLENHMAAEPKPGALTE